MPTGRVQVLLPGAAKIAKVCAGQRMSLYHSLKPERQIMAVI